MSANRATGTGQAVGPQIDRIAAPSPAAGFHRYEYKYRLPLTMVPELRRALVGCVAPDPFALNRPERRYTVRSIYFDSEDLVFYHEKADSVCVRKKLRIRGYERPADNAPIFFEIKRKHGRLGFKERLSLPASQLLPALAGGSGLEASLPFTKRCVIQRFRYNVRANNLRPVVLVSYEREPMVGVDHPDSRVTFDLRLRSLIDPRLDQLFAERELRAFEDGHFILELKFDQRMPSWMARLVRDFDLRRQSYSKYCHGIDAWQSHPR